MPSKGDRRRARQKAADAAPVSACGVPYCEGAPWSNIGHLPCGHVYCAQCLMKTVHVCLGGGGGPEFISRCHLCRKMTGVVYDGVVKLLVAACPDKAIVMKVGDRLPDQAVVVGRDCNCGECEGVELCVMEM